MKTNIQKTVSLLLALTLLFTAMPAVFAAQPEEDQYDDGEE